MEKAIEIKRRAQRCIQNGDLDGALSEYEKLVAIEDSDPYNLVLLADLLFKKGDSGQAGQRYLGAAAAYEKQGLYKNAIAVCKKLMRLQLAPSQVFYRLATLHQLDGLSTEASLYFQQHAENLAREERYKDAAESLRQAFTASNENVKALERLAEVQLLIEKKDAAVQTLLEAAQEYGKAGQLADGERCRRRAAQLDPSTRDIVAANAADAPATLPGAASEANHRFSSTVDEPDVAPPDTLEFEKTTAPAPSADEGEGIQRLSDLESTSRKPALAPRPAALPAREPARPKAPVVESPPPVHRLRELEPEEAPLAEAQPGMNGDTYEEGNAALTEIEPAAPEPIEIVAEPKPAPEPARAASKEIPSLRFEAPEAPASAATATLADVERMLTKAQQCFRAGQREAASEALAAAAQAYDALGRFDSAATIYRSLGKSAHATSEMLERWIANCERRGDRTEAAQVACELGDGALNEGHVAVARSWFERAREFDATNEVSVRRLQRMSGGAAAPKDAAPQPPQKPAIPDPASKAPRPAGGAQRPNAASGSSGNEPGRVEVAVGRGEAVTFDLGSLIAEFQRGVESQLSGDAQSHYDLGMSYREMGLLEQAVDSFRVAAADPAYGLRAMEMVGRCLRDQGRFDEAIEEFERGLSHPGLEDMVRLSLHYEMGLTYEASGSRDLALAEFEAVHGERPDFSDVRVKLRALRKPGSA